MNATVVSCEKTRTTRAPAPTKKGDSAGCKAGHTQKRTIDSASVHVMLNSFLHSDFCREAGGERAYVVWPNFFWYVAVQRGDAHPRTARQRVLRDEAPGL